jgi:hypothetical protein
LGSVALVVRVYRPAGTLLKVSGAVIAESLPLLLPLPFHRGRVGPAAARGRAGPVAHHKNAAVPGLVVLLIIDEARNYPGSRGAGCRRR